ncbi:hypothetical protein BGZ76_010755 [Entomortierella beljakovae]|nr:hypothetical protein BGZ76_010755 [Entomortierella beljakovae]
MSRGSSPAEERRLQVKFASPSESGQCASALAPYFCIKAVGVTQNLDSSVQEIPTFTPRADGLLQNKTDSCSQSQLVKNSQDFNHSGEISNSQVSWLGFQQVSRPSANPQSPQPTNEIERLLSMPDQAFKDKLNCILTDPMFSNLLVKVDRALRR